MALVDEFERLSAAFAVGDKVQVFSRSLSAWLPGQVIELDGDEVNVDGFVEVCDIYGLHLQVE